MSLNKSLIAEMTQEAATTRKVLERVPSDKLAWKPHEKSMSLGRLATHVAELPKWTATTVQQDSLDLSGPYNPNILESTGDIVNLFEKNLAEALEALADVSDETLRKPWTLTVGEKTVFTLPKAAVLRTMVFNHIVHHRGQLSVYLRLNGVPVPAMYGPSADEGAF